MAIDFLIFGLLIVSFVINFLALAAFWITPGLRTTANRFTINLLIINLIGCLILAPTLFLSSSAAHQQELEKKQQQQQQQSNLASSTINDDSIEFYSKPGNHQMIIRHNGHLVEEEGIIVQKNDTRQEANNNSNNNNNNIIETLYKCNSTFCQEVTINENSDTIVITEFEEQIQNNNNNNLPITLSPKASSSLSEEKTILEEKQEVEKEFVTPLLPIVTMRCWSIDMAAALGALAVLLVVGDTWCAVTDPLRYHSRISGVKAWVFIALTWTMGILFGALSAFRTLDFEADTFLTKKRHRYTYTEAYYSLYSSNGIFDMAFACIYFVVIILLPFGFVCGMYWRIFSEARENGLRMRQNGSSPLLQSALNLTQHQQQHQQQQQQQATITANNANSQQHQQQQLAIANMHRNSISSASSSQGFLGCGLQMQIDHNRKTSPATIRRDSVAKVLLPTISDDNASLGETNEHVHAEEEEDDVDDDELIANVNHYMNTIPEQEQQSIPFPDRNQNILLTLQSASGEIKRNYSARQLPILGMSSQDLAEADRLRGIRQVHSSPNLQKFTDILEHEAILNETTCSVHLLGYNQLQHTQQQRHHHHQVAAVAAVAATSARHQQHYQQNRRHSHVLQIPGMMHNSSSPKGLGYMSSLRHRLSNASSLFKYREESRAARISILVVFMFLISYMPYGFLVLLQSRLPAANFSTSSQLAIAMILMGYLTSPFIFAYRNKRVRRGVKRLFGLDPTHVQERSFHSLGGGSTNGGAARNRSSPAFIKRNSSKVSTYSLNSCRHITPQNSVASNDVTVVTHLRPSLRPNASCSTIINFMLTKHSNGVAADTSSSGEHKLANQQTSSTATTTTQMPTTMHTMTLVAANKPASAKPRNLFKILFRSSQNLSRSVKSCAQGGNNHNSNGYMEPVEV